MNNFSQEHLVNQEDVHAAPNSHASRQSMTQEDVWDSQAQEIPESQITEGSASEPDDVIDLSMTDDEEEEEEEEESDMDSFIVSDDEPVLETQDSYKPSQCTDEQTSDEEDTDDKASQPGSQPVTKGHYYRHPMKKEVVVLVTPVKTQKCNKRKNM